MKKKFPQNQINPSLACLLEVCYNEFFFLNQDIFLLAVYSKSQESSKKIYRTLCWCAIVFCCSICCFCSEEREKTKKIKNRDSAGIGDERPSQTGIIVPSIYRYNRCRKLILSHIHTQFYLHASIIFFSHSEFYKNKNN